MKTSLNIADDLMARAKKHARKKKTTVRQLVEHGLRLVLKEENNADKPKANLVVFGGDGFSEQFNQKSLSWSDIRNEVYKGHGE